jgi:high affinity Mn2+ porin
MRRWTFQFVASGCVMLAAFSIAAARSRAQDSPPVQAQVPLAGDSNADADSTPAMFAHPETDRWWVSGQANFISQWHPEFHSPYQGPNSLTPEAQDATSRVLTFFTGVRLSDTTELICDVQEAGGHGISEALGLAGATNLDVVRNPTLSKAPYIARLMWHQIIPLSKEKAAATRTPFSLFSTLPVRRLEIRFGKMSLVDFSMRIHMARTRIFSSQTGRWITTGRTTMRQTRVVSRLQQWPNTTTGAGWCDSPKR